MSLNDIKKEMKGYKDELLALNSVKSILSKESGENITELLGSLKDELGNLNTLKPVKLDILLDKTYKTISIAENMLDLLFYLSDVEQVSEIEYNKKRTKTYAKIMKCREEVKERYLDGLKKFIADKKEVIILFPIFPNIGPQSLSSLSELKWIRELILEENDDELFRNNVKIHFFWLNNAFLKGLCDTIAEDEEKRSYFTGYKKPKVFRLNSILKLNKLRMESFFKRYLISYMVEQKKMEILTSELAGELDGKIKTYDESIDKDILDQYGIKIKKPVEDAPNQIREQLMDLCRKNKQTVNEYCCFSDISMKRISQFDTIVNSEGVVDRDTPTTSYENLLDHIKKSCVGEGKCCIVVQSYKWLILYKPILKEMGYLDKVLFWPAYIPAIRPSVIPTFEYLSILSKSYNAYSAWIYPMIVYNCDNKHGKQTACYLMHYLGPLFEDVLKVFRIAARKPMCEKDGRDRETILVKEKDHEECGTDHWLFKCPIHGEEYYEHEENIFLDCLYFPMELYYEIESIFLDIPYTFMLASRVFKDPPSRKVVDEQKLMDEFDRVKEKRFNVAKDIQDINKNLEKQYDFIMQS